MLHNTPWTVEVPGKQPSLSESLARKWRQGKRQKSLFPPSSGRWVEGDFLGHPLAHWACSVMLHQISGSSFGKPQKKYLAITRRASGRSPSKQLCGGTSAGPVWVPSQVPLWACCPSLLPHWLRRLDLLVEQWRVVSGAAAPDPVHKQWLQNKADLEARWAGLFRCLVFIM